MAVAIGGLAAAVALGGLYRLAAEPLRPLKEDELARITRQVRSLAGESALLAELVSGDRVTARYFRSHREKIAEELREQAGKLETAMPAARRQQGFDLRALVGELGADLHELELRFAEPEAVREIHDDALRIAREASALEPSP
jgi:hypothetical protein